MTERLRRQWTSGPRSSAPSRCSCSFVITLEPIFSGLAWSFIFGIFASTAFSLVVVPLVYFMINRNTGGRQP